MNIDEKEVYNINARLDRLPGWSFPWHVLLTCGVAFFFAFFDIVIIGLGLNQITRHFDVTQDLASWSISSGLFGYIIGSFVVSRISDLLGRRLGLCISVALYVVGCLLCGISPSIFWLIAFRFVTGMGIGSEISGAVTYIGELSPTNSRGKSVAIAVAMGFVGFAVAPFIALAILPHFSWGWRILFYIGGGMGVTFFFLRLFLPQSPRWLALKGHYKEASDNTTVAEDIAEVRYHYPKGKVIPFPENEQIAHKTDPKLSSLIFSSYFKRLVLFGFIWLFYYNGNYAWLTLNDILLIDHGYSSSKSILFVGLTSLGFLVGSYIGIVIGDVLERKWICCILALIWAVSLMFIASFPSEAMILAIGFIAAITIAAIIPTMYCYTAENFGTLHRATGVAITDGFGHLGGAFCSQTVFFFYNFFGKKGLGFQAAYMSMAVTGFVAAILLMFGNKMTKRSLMTTSMKKNTLEV